MNTKCSIIYKKYILLNSLKMVHCHRSFNMKGEMHSLGWFAEHVQRKRPHKKLIIDQVLPVDAEGQMSKLCSIQHDTCINQLQ